MENRPKGLIHQGRRRRNRRRISVGIRNASELRRVLSSGI
jgi:hypothetical protein